MHRDPRCLCDLTHERRRDAVEVVLPRGRVEATRVDGSRRSWWRCTSPPRRSGSSISASSAPAFVAWMSAITSCSFAVTVELLVERVRWRPADRRREQRDALIPYVGIGRLVLGDDHDVRSADVVRRVLRLGVFLSPRVIINRTCTDVGACRCGRRWPAAPPRPRRGPSRCRGRSLRLRRTGGRGAGRGGRTRP